MSFHKLFDFTIKVYDTEWENNLVNDLEIDKTNLDEEFSQQPRIYAYYATLHELAQDKVNRLKRELDILYAQIDSEKRAEAEHVKSKNPKMKYTEKMFSNMVTTDERYQKKHLELLDGQKTAGLMKVAKQALEQKKESLISMGANFRTAGTGTDFRVLQQSAKERNGKSVDDLKEKAKRKRKPRNG